VIERLHNDIASEASPVHHLIIDANAVADIDYTGAKAFAEFVAECKQRGISVTLARVPNLVHHDLKHSGLLKTIGPDHLFASVEEAVASVAPPAGLPTVPTAG
jgi:MFS superfamily sulfate permease-like transporter